MPNAGVVTINWVNCLGYGNFRKSLKRYKTGDGSRSNAIDNMCLENCSIHGTRYRQEDSLCGCKSCWILCRNKKFIVALRQAGRRVNDNITKSNDLCSWWTFLHYVQETALRRWPGCHTKNPVTDLSEDRLRENMAQLIRFYLIISTHTYTHTHIRKLLLISIIIEGINIH